ncbi:DUF11 domain-containing protein [Cetobacterium sp. 2G large]|uniref:DUF11 domain-containing protein n=1 Tax=Cetobacterium sp. 2G large TaxID=2759680 RepID=UPI00163BD30A|nr:DUF11 domain-containing protein [Cetobacterium sp. 2G large]MBC2854234.1 DUF11 domain-containing protein [Cetobacterium sp. 2G large]
MKVKNYVKLILFAILSFFTTTMAYSASPTPFTGREQEVGYISQQTGSSSGNVSVRAIDLSDGTIAATYNNIYSYTPGQLVNAFGYNSQDNFMYAIRQRKFNGQFQIVLERIGKDPNNTSKLLVETITGPLATSSERIATNGQYGKTYVNTGTFDLAGNMYIIAGNQDKTYIYKITRTQDIGVTTAINTTNDYVVEAIVSGIPSGIELGDWAYNQKDGRLYFVNRDVEGNIYSMSTSGGNLTKLSTTKGPGVEFTGEDIVGVFFDNNNNLYIYNTKNGKTFKVNVAGDKVIVPYIDDLGPAGGGDGARNIEKPVTTKPQIKVSKEFLTGEGLPIYDDTNKVLKLKYKVTIQNLNNLILPHLNLTDELNFDHISNTSGIKFEASSLPTGATLDVNTGEISNIMLPGATSTSKGKVEIEFFVVIPYSLITHLDNDVLNTIKVTTPETNDVWEDSAEGTFEVKEIVFLDKKLTAGPNYSDDGLKATATYTFTVENPLNMPHTKLSVKDLFVDKDNWEVSISKISVDGNVLTPDANGDVEVSTAGIGALGTNTINVTIEYDLTNMSTENITLYDYGQVTSYIKDPNNGTLADTTEEVPTPLIRIPKVSLVKSLVRVDYANPLEPIATYSFKITNETKIPISGLTLTDKLTNMTGLKAKVIDATGNGVYLSSDKTEITIPNIEIPGAGDITKTIYIKYLVVDMTSSQEIVKNTAYIYPKDSQTPFDTSEEVETPLTRTPALVITKTPGNVVYNQDGTANVIYTFTVTNGTKIPYSDLTIVDKIITIDKITIDAASVIGGTYDATNNLITTSSFALAGEETKSVTVTVKYNLNDMIARLETVTDKGYIYDTSNNTNPGTGTENDGYIGQTEEVSVDFTKTPVLTIIKSATTPVIEGDVASVTYTFTVNNPTLIPTSVTVVDKVLSLGNLKIIEATYNGIVIGITDNILVLPIIENLVGTENLEVTFKYNLNDMTTTIDSVTDRAYLYDNTTNSYVAGDPAGPGQVNIPSEVVKVDFEKSPSVTIEKKASTVKDNGNNTSEVTYTFTVNNPTKIPYENLTIVDKIISLEDLKITSVIGGSYDETKGVITLDSILDFTGSIEKTLVITYDTKNMAKEIESAIDKAYLYDTSGNKDPGEGLNEDENILDISDEVKVDFTKEPKISISKSASTPIYNTDGTASVTYTFTVNNPTKIPTSVTVVDKIKKLDELTIESIKYGEDTLTINNNVIILPEIVDLVGEKKVSIIITYNLDDMTSISNSVTDKAFAYSDPENPYVPGNNPESSEEQNKNTPSEEVTVPITKSPTATIEKSRGDVSYNNDGTADVIYTFTIKNSTLIPITSLELKDKIYNLGKVTINSVVEVLDGPDAFSMRNTLESKELESYTIWNLGTIYLPGNGEVVKKYKINYNLDSMETTSQTVKNVGIINILHDENPLGTSDEVDTVLTKDPKASILKTPGKPVYNEDGTVSVTYTFTVTNETNIPYAELAVVDKIVSLNNLTIASVEDGIYDKDLEVIVLDSKIENLLGLTTKDVTVTVIYDLEGMTTTVDTATDKAFLYDTSDGKEPGTGSEDESNPPVGETDNVTIEVSKDATIEIEKSSTSVVYNSLNNQADITYKFIVENLTNIPYNGVTIKDTLTDLGGLTVAKVSSGWTRAGNIVILNESFDVAGKATSSKEITVTYNLNGMIVDTTTVKDIGALVNPNTPNVNITVSEEVSVDLYKDTVSLRQDVFNVTDNYQDLFTNLPSASEKNANPLSVEPSSQLLYFATLENSNPAVATNVTINTDHTLVKDTDGANVFTTLEIQGFVYAGKDGVPVEFKSTDLNVLKAKLEELGYKVDSITPTEIKFSQVPGDSKLSLVLGATISPDATFSDNFAIENFASLNGDDPKALGGDDTELRRTLVLASLDDIPVTKTAGTLIYDPVTGIATIPYEITFTNTGSIPLSGLTLEDVMTPGVAELGEIKDVVVTNGTVSDLTVSNITVAVGETWTMTFKLLVPYSKVEDGLKVTNEAILKKGSVVLGKDDEVVDLEKPNLTLRQDVFNVTDNYQGLFTNLPSASEKNANPLSVEPSSQLLYFATLENSNPAVATNVTINTDHTLVKDTDGANVFTTLEIQGFVYAGKDGVPVEFKSTDLNVLKAKLEELGYKVDSITPTEIKFSQVPGDSKLSLVLGATISPDATFSDNFAIENFASLNGDDPKALGGDDTELRRTLVLASLDDIPVTKTAGTLIYDPVTGIATIPYEITFTNTGSIPLSGLTLEDVMTPGVAELGEVKDVVVTNGTVADLTVSNITVAVGETWTMTFKLLVPYSKVEDGLKVTNEAILKKGSVVLGKDDEVVDLEKPNLTLRQDVFNVTDNYQGLFTNLPSASEKNANPLSVEPSSQLLYFATLENSNPAVATNVTINTDHTSVKDTAGANVFTTLEIQGFVYAGKDGVPVEFKSTDLNVLKAKLEELGYKVDSITPTEIKFSQVPGDSKLSLVLGATISPDATFSDNFVIENFASLNGDDPKALNGDAAELRRTLVLASLDKIEVDKSSKTPIYDPNLKVVQIPYEIKVTNTGSTNLTGLILEDILVPGLSELGVIKDVSLTNGTVNEGGETIQDITINVGDIWTVNFILEVTFDKVGDNGITIENTAILKKGDVELGKDSETVEVKKYSVKLRNDVFTIDTNITNTASNLPTATLKNSKPPVVKPGSNVLYFVTLTNENNGIVKDTKIRNDQVDLTDTEGTSPAFEDIQFKGVIITDKDGKQTYLDEVDVDKLVAFLESNDYQTSAPQVRAMRAISTNGAIGTETSNFAIIPANSSVTYVLNAKVNSTGTFKQNYEIENFAELNDDNPKNTLTGDEYELRRTLLLVALDGDLVLQKVSEKDEASVGKFVPYTITVKNNSTATVTNIYIKDNIPPGFVFVKDSARIVDNLTNTSIKVPATGGKEVVVGPIESIAANTEIQVTYLLKVGVGVKPGKYTNTAVVVDENKNPLSNQDSADVDIVPDELFDTTTIIGKVFHDRDEDGIQDYGMARGVIIEINLKDKSYVSGSSIAKQYGMSIPVKDSDKFKVDLIDGRISEAESPLNHVVTIRKQVLRPDAVDSIRVTTKDGTDITLHSDGKIVTKHTGDKKAGMTSQDIQIGQKILKNKKGEMFVEIYVANNGIQEEGIPGVRLATVEGLVMETDKHGRYHLPPVTQEKGKNLIIKVDPATLPKGSVFTTENPRVRHLGRVIMKFNFGVKLPELQEVYQPMTPTVVGKEVLYK